MRSWMLKYVNLVYISWTMNCVYQKILKKTWGCLSECGTFGQNTEADLHQITEKEKNPGSSQGPDLQRSVEMLTSRKLKELKQHREEDWPKTLPEPGLTVTS